MTTLTIVQARMGSERLPGKVLADIGGQPVLERVLARVAMADLGRVVVATSARVVDYPIVDFCQALGVEWYTSSERDVLNRYYRTALAYDACEPEDGIVRVTADCPLLCPELLRTVVDWQAETGFDYVGVVGAPTGFGQECVRFEALADAWAEADSGYDREHAITFIESQPDRFRVAYVEADRPLRERQHFRLTLDEQADLDLLRRLYGVTGGALFSMSSQSILDAVASDAALTAMAVRPL